MLASPRKICSLGKLPHLRVLILCQLELHLFYLGFVYSKHQMYETATLAASNLPNTFKETQQQVQQHSVMGTQGGVKIKHVAHKSTAPDNAESALPATASW